MKKLELEILGNKLQKNLYILKGQMKWPGLSNRVVTLVEISSEIQIRSHENIVTEISLGSYVIHDIYEFFQIRI